MPFERWSALGDMRYNMKKLVDGIRKSLLCTVNDQKSIRMESQK